MPHLCKQNLLQRRADKVKHSSAIGSNINVHNYIKLHHKSKKGSILWEIFKKPLLVNSKPFPPQMELCGGGLFFIIIIIEVECLTMQVISTQDLMSKKKLSIIQSMSGVHKAREGEGKHK